MTDNSLLRQITKAATRYPRLRPHLSPLIRSAARELEAAADTADFVEWVLNTQSQAEPSKIEAFVNGVLRVATRAPKTRRPGLRFVEGDGILVDMRKHEIQATAAPYMQYNGKTGTVEHADETGVEVRLDGVPELVRFEGAQAPRGVGLLKYIPPYTAIGSAQMFEAIYLRDTGGNPSDEEVMQVARYLTRGKPGEKRSAHYYSGHVFTAYNNKDGQFYFRAAPQQRVLIDPQAPKEFQWRTFNPSKGQMLYLGVLGRRPAHWREELAALRS